MGEAVNAASYQADSPSRQANNNVFVILILIMNRQAEYFTPQYRANLLRRLYVEQDSVG
jgi:hypothetical protein